PLRPVALRQGGAGVQRRVHGPDRGGPARGSRLPPLRVLRVGPELVLSGQARGRTAPRPPPSAIAASSFSRSGRGGPSGAPREAWGGSSRGSRPCSPRPAGSPPRSSTRPAPPGGTRRGGRGRP